MGEMPNDGVERQANLAARAAAVVEELHGTLTGEMRQDALARALYATDASIYEIIPEAVVWPRSAAEVAAVVRACGKHNVPVTPRGAGTGLTGGAVNFGIQLDLSRHLNRIQEIDPAARTARVESGVVLDELNTALAPHGLHFAPDVATSSRATIGGMIANNSCGAHSIITGRTVDHVLSLETVLSDGSVCTWGPDSKVQNNPLARRGAETLATVARTHAEQIATRYPRVMRRNSGYGLDRLRLDADRLNTEAVLCGSEGTLAIVTAATLNLLPLPRHKVLMVVHYESVPAALASVPRILTHKPAAVELVDKLLLDATRNNPVMARKRWFLQGDPHALLAVELFDDDADRLRKRLDNLVADLQAHALGYAWPILAEAAAQQDVWEVRKAGLGLLMSKPGDDQPCAFVEDTAVDPARLHDFIKRFSELLAEEDVPQVGYYAHASVGCLHVRPVLNLKRQEGVDRLRRIGERVSSLVLEFGGTMTAEHGDGIIRSAWLEKMFGPELVDAFRRIKEAFDPQNILNPGKIVDPLPLEANLRYGADFKAQQPPTTLDFSEHGGMAGLAEMCSGVGQCRQRLVGTMCPSYRATGEEKDSTRARANALRLALSNRDLLQGLADPALEEVFDLCLSCKACKTECPTGTDVAKLKAEWLAHRNLRVGVPRRSRLIARSIELAIWGSRLAPFSNWIMQSKVTRAFMEHFYGLDRRVPPPAFAPTTFRKWFRGHCRRRAKSALPARKVVYFVDTWVNYYTPQVGRAAVKVLEALGYHVLVPPTVCCGRPLISKGMLAEAKLLAAENVRVLASYAQQGIPIVGTEPSCVSTLTDELPQLVRARSARRIAELAETIESFVSRALEENPTALRFKADQRPLLYHGHCHQKALVGTESALSLLRGCTGDKATEINSGCCGMAGAFGHEVEHYDVARAIGEERLFPAVRGRGESEVAISGFSCRQHIQHHTDARPRHVIEYVADALAD